MGCKAAPRQILSFHIFIHNISSFQNLRHICKIQRKPMENMMRNSKIGKMFPTPPLRFFKDKEQFLQRGEPEAWFSVHMSLLPLLCHWTNPRTNHNINCLVLTVLVSTPIECAVRASPKCSDPIGIGYLWQPWQASRYRPSNLVNQTFSYCNATLISFNRSNDRCYYRHGLSINPTLNTGGALYLSQLMTDAC